MTGLLFVGLAMTAAMEQAFANEPAMGPRVMGRIPLRRLGDPQRTDRDDRRRKLPDQLTGGGT